MDMLSTAVTRDISVLPSIMFWQAISVARIPEAQFWLTIQEPLLTGSPTFIPIIRGGREPLPACRQVAPTISSIIPGSTPALSIAALAAIIARSLALTLARPPKYLPIGVLAIPTTTTSLISAIVCIPP